MLPKLVICCDTRTRVPVKITKCLEFKPPPHPQQHPDVVFSVCMNVFMNVRMISKQTGEI